MRVGAGQRRDIDDVAAAAFFHFRNCIMTAIEDAEHICLEDCATIFGCSLLNRVEDADTPIVDQNVQATESRYCVIDQTLDLVILAYVTGKQKGITGSESGHLSRPHSSGEARGNAYR